MLAVINVYIPSFLESNRQFHVIFVCKARVTINEAFPGGVKRRIGLNWSSLNRAYFTSYSA